MGICLISFPPNLAPCKRYKSQIGFHLNNTILCLSTKSTWYQSPWLYLWFLTHAAFILQFNLIAAFIVALSSDFLITAFIATLFFVPSHISPCFFPFWIKLQEICIVSELICGEIIRIVGGAPTVKTKT